MSKYRNSYKSRKTFIDTLFNTSKIEFDDPIKRYQAMGLRAYLTDYLNGETTNYVHAKKNENLTSTELVKKAKFNKNGTRKNGFIALNVEAPVKNGKKSPIIPFFSILVNGDEDTLTEENRVAGIVDKNGDVVEGLRDKVIRISRDSVDDDFYTCPAYMNEHNLEKIMFRVYLKNGAIDKIDIPLASSFDERENQKIKDRLDLYLKEGDRGKTPPKEYEKLDKGNTNTFLYSWCAPFLESGCSELVCNVRAVDRDEEGNSHSIFVSIFETEAEISEWVQDYGEDVMNIIAMVKSVFIADVQRAQRKEAIKSAKAAIMSRNMSHNLGSHVMAYLKHHLSSVKDMLNDKILSQLFDNEDDLKSLIESPSDYSPKLLAKLSVRATEEDETTVASTSNTANNAVVSNNSEEDVINNVALPFLVGLGQFISYLQERQDFIATIATDYIPYYSTVNFKDFIYDELNNDKRYERHPDRQNLKPDNILLGNIARSEGLGRVTCPTNTIDDKTTLHDIVLKFRTIFNGDPVEEIKRPRVNPFDYYSETDLPKAKEELDEMRNYDVSLPGGIVGRQAIFSIIENIIRNAAKHGNWREKGKLEITIDIFSKDDVLDSNPTDSLKKRLRDDDNSSTHSLSLKQVLLKYYCGDGDKGNDLYFITITDNLSMPLQGADEKEGIAPASISSLRKALIEDYIDETSQMKNSNKGMKEMRISSAWLRSMEDDKRYYLYDENKYNLEDGLWGDTSNDVPPVLYARISKDCEGDCHLQYIFCLVRPQKIAFVSSEFSSLSKETDQILRKSFWKAFTPESFFNHHNKSFDLVVYDGARKKDDPFYSQIRRISSSKFLCLQDDDVALKDVIQLKECIIKGESLSKKKLEAAELLLYRHLSHWDGSEHILISDIKAESHFNQDAQKDVNVGDKISFKLDDPAAKYRYLTHLEDRVKFKEHIIKDYDYASRFKFSEGITGNNSTDRLVRNERLTEIWFYKHLHAMKKKVAIFDERIFSKSFGLEESDLSIPVFDDPRYASYKNASEEVRQAFLKFRNLSPRIDLDAVDTKNYIGATYVFKGVFVFSIIRSNEDNRAFNLYGCRINLCNDNTFSECIRFASISWNEKEKKLDISPCEGVDSGVLSGYDAISIHQGLLDKLYGLFGIKSDSQARENLTRVFYSQFVGDKNIIDFTEPGRDNVVHHFLPGMTIHSGRSKPSENDMPQRLPFIPFSAIEHAVLDCKYSLIELLDSARYE